MKISDIRDFNVDEIKHHISDLKKTLFNLRFQHEIGQLENPKKMLNIRKDVARLKTVLTDKLLN